MYFKINKSKKTGRYWWVAKSSGNNETLCSSELLNTKAACKSAITIMQSGAANAPIRDATGETRAFRRRAA